MADRAEVPEAFESLLELLKFTRGFDFTGYKRNSLMRRVQKRMGMIGIGDFSDYQDYLELHPEEFTELFDTILINVTSFFRDEEAWDYLANEVVPRLVEEKGDVDPIRVWCAGVASGEEAYSIVMLLSEAIGARQLNERVKVYATDIDEDALTQGRHGVYSAEDLEPVPAALREKYFEIVNGRSTFRKDLRRVVIFGRHDLVQDAPISRVDLLVCRNTLMYFNAETQARILAQFHFALNDTGTLFLGKSEMLLTHTALFTPTDLKRRVFGKTPAADALEALAGPGFGEHHDPKANVSDLIRLRDTSFDSSPLAQLAVDLKGTVVMVNQQGRLLLGLAMNDVGKPLQDLEVSYRPVELRSQIERVYAERRTVTVRNVQWDKGEGDRRFVDVEIAPILSGSGSLLGAGVSFHDVTRSHLLQEELIQSKRELEAAYEELQSTVEELETTNEELHSTVEELETTNEELQSTNEELETMNEELQSTNEELETLNTEIQDRTNEVDSLNSYLESLMAGVTVGVIVVDELMRVTVWNARAEDMWGLRAGEVQGENLLSLDIGLPMEPIVPLIRGVLSGEEPKRSDVRVEVMNRRGKPVTMRVTCTPLHGPAGKVGGAILLLADTAADV